jgi:hypothetical protein
MKITNFVETLVQRTAEQAQNEQEFDLSMAALQIVAEAIRKMRDLGCSQEKIANILEIAVAELRNSEEP